MEESEENRNRVLDFLRSADTGIVDMSYQIRDDNDSPPDVDGELKALE